MSQSQNPTPGEKTHGAAKNGTSALSAGIASVCVAVTLVLIKLWALWQTGSLSIAASLTDSALDLSMSLGAAAAIIYASRPPDDNHAFGHTSVEDLAALAQSICIILSAGVIAWSATTRLSGQGEVNLASESEGIWVMVISILLTLALVWWQGRVAAATGSRVVAADRLHYLGDLLPSLGAIFALWMSGRFGLEQIDALIALLAAGIMAFGALRIGKTAWDALMDRAAPPEVIQDIARITASWPGVLGYHDLKTRTSGSRLFVNLHIELEGSQTLYQAHDVSKSLKAAILAAHPRADVIIHQDVAKAP